MKLLKDDCNQLLTVILESYPDINDLEILVYIELEENLSSIAGGNNDKQKVFKLIQWAKSNDKLNQLIKALAKDRPQQQFLQDINNKFHPSIFNIMQLPSDNSQLISNSEWNQLYFILNQVNDTQLITKVCKETLRNSQNDLLGNCLELSNNIELRDLKEILLNKFSKRYDNVPTIIEFAERLSSEINRQLSERLEQWIENVATKLDIDLPTYSKFPLNNDIYKYFLLITVLPKGKNQFELEPDLLLYNCEADSYEPIPKFVNWEENSEENNEEKMNKCDFAEIKDKIIDVVKVCQDYLQFPYILHIELFLTYPYLGYAFDIEEIVIDQDRKSQSYLGKEYPLLVSSYDRFSNKINYNQFRLRWCTNVQNKLKPNLAKLIEFLQELEAYNRQSLDELANQWELDEIIGLKIMGCWCDEEDVQEDLFYYIIKSGIPLALWIRCNDLLDCKKQLNDLLTLDPLNNWHDLFEQVRKCRKKAYKKPNELGYHLGILSDDPQRIPSHFKHLIETGK